MDKYLMDASVNYAKKNPDVIKKSGKAIGKFAYDNKEVVADYAYENREAIGKFAYEHKEQIADAAYEN